MTDPARETARETERAGGSYNIADARRHFSDLVARAEAGEEIVINRGNRPVARLAPLEPKPPRRPGLARHWTLPEDLFLEPADEEELAIASGEYTDAVGIWTGPPKTPDDDTSGNR